MMVDLINKYRLQHTRLNLRYWDNILNNNTKFKDQLEAESVSTSRNMCTYINIPKSYEFKLK